MATDFKKAAFGLLYEDGTDISEGDIAWYHDPDSLIQDVVVYFYWDPLTFSFKAKPTNQRNSGSWSLGWHGSQDRKYRRLGSIYDDPFVLPLWEKAGKIESSSIFIRQSDSSTCFPLAVLNACIGAGAPKAFLNFKLLKRLVEIGECSKWGGCIDEQSVLNAAQSELDVTFVLDEFMSTVETGGVVTVSDGSTFHAVASFVSDGCPFLVNMSGFPFVVPAKLVTLQRSPDEKHHRDYTILENS